MSRVRFTVVLLPVLAMLLLAGRPAAARAQTAPDAPISAALSAAPTEATVGDPLTISLSVSHPAGYRLVPPELPAAWGPYTVVGQTAPKTAPNPDGSETSTLQIDARLFATGAFATPPLELTLTDGQGGLVSAVAPPTAVTITSVLTEEDTELRDIKPQAALPYVNWLLVALGGLGLAAAAGVFLYSRRRPAPVPALDPRTPTQIALDELATIERLALPQQGRFKEHYTLVSDTVRGYIGARYRFPVLERTTSEIRAELRQADVPAEVAGPLLELLAESDLVKFTTLTPDPAAAEAIIGQARGIVEAAQPTVDMLLPAEPPPTNGTHEKEAIG